MLFTNGARLWSQCAPSPSQRSLRFEFQLRWALRSYSNNHKPYAVLVTLHVVKSTVSGLHPGEAIWTTPCRRPGKERLCLQRIVVCGIVAASPLSPSVHGSVAEAGRPPDSRQHISSQAASCWQDVLLSACLADTRNETKTANARSKQSLAKLPAARKSILGLRHHHLRWPVRWGALRGTLNPHAQEAARLLAQPP